MPTLKQQPTRLALCRAAAPTAGLLALCLPTRAALADWPMYYLESFGPRGQAIADLTWGLLALSVAVVLIIALLVLFGVARPRSIGPGEAGRRLPVTRGGGGVRWIYIGLVPTTIALIGSITWTVVTLAAIDEPPSEPRFTIEITGQQWWWEVRYLSDDPSRIFETANEIHIPVGEPVRLKLTSADVIHTFWVPALSGKTDLIPGQTNETWLQADEPGVYWGQCNEYCGRQHTHMALRLFADPPEEFEVWWDAQVQSANPPETEMTRTGQTNFVLRCGACHAVRGTLAGGELGPDLTHLMSRTTLAAGMLPNTVGHLSGWIANPQFIKPGSEMPNLELSGPQLDAIRSYLLTLD
jgi:cytochrome c oxidase subunit II